MKYVLTILIIAPIQAIVSIMINKVTGVNNLHFLLIPLFIFLYLIALSYFDEIL